MDKMIWLYVLVTSRSSRVTTHYIILLSKFKVKEAWAEVPSSTTSAVVRRRPKKTPNNADDDDLNLINNNNNNNHEHVMSVSMKRRSFHPQDHVSRAFEPESRRKRRPAEFPKSGSQNDLCDTWTPEEEEAEFRIKKQQQQQHRRPHQISAEYPFQANSCMPPQAINFDLTYKRGKHHQQ